MTAYEKLEIHNNPMFGEHLKNIDSVNADLFEKEKILRFADKYNSMPDEVREKVLEALEEIKNDAGYVKIAKAIFYCLKNDIDPSHFKPDFNEGIKAQFVMFFPVWYMLEEFADDMEKRGINKEIIIKSLAPVCGCIKRNEGLAGEMGTSAFFSWIYKYGKGELFRINDFEYETSKHEGKDIINIHIPAKTKLDVCENLKSFKGALEFFDKFYPEFKMIGLKCESWLLSRQIEEVMEGPTNISRFGDMFDHYDIGDEWGDAVFRFVYNFAAPYPPVEDVPENTTLQKKLKAYMLLGKRVYAMGGTISRQKLEEKLKEFEV